MKAELIAVGTELLMGQIANTNGQYLGQQCAALGIDVYFHTVVGDNMGRIQQVLQLAESRADLIILTGGLGPTQDDLTKEAVAAFVGRTVTLDHPSLARIESFFQQRGIHMVENNRRQALRIEGSTLLPNDTGLAVGDALTVDGTHYILLPGPPREMKPMFEQYAVPWLQSNAPLKAPLHSVVFKFAGIGESTLEHELHDLIAGQSDPTIAPYAKEGEVAVRVTTRAASADEAAGKLRHTCGEIRSRLDSYIFAEEDIRLEEAAVRLLKRLGLTIAAAESCTGGLLADSITNIAGSSAVFKGGVVCYTDEVKLQLLKVPEQVLAVHGAVSEACAAAMAENVCRVLGAGVGVSITGVAGPETVGELPVGLVYIGIAAAGEPAQVYELQLSGQREVIKLRAAKHAAYRLWQFAAGQL